MTLTDPVIVTEIQIQGDRHTALAPKFTPRAWSPLAYHIIYYTYGRNYGCHWPFWRSRQSLDTR